MKIVNIDREKKIEKRSGEIQTFDPHKIFNAISRAIDETGVDLRVRDVNLIMDDILHGIRKRSENIISVEQVQDIVVDVLLNYNRELALGYQSYRAVQAHKRLMSYEKFYDKLGDIIDVTAEKENSNKNYKMQSVVRDTIAGEFFRERLLTLLPEHLAKAHISKAIHWHDSDVDTKYTNCCLFNIEDMLENGTRINNADVEQPHSVGTAMNIGMQIIASISAQQYGGVSLPNFNEVFAKYAKMNFNKNFIKICNARNTSHLSDSMLISSDNIELEEKMPIEFNLAKEWTRKDIYDACQLFEYQNNSVLGSASQTPFSTITCNIPTSWESEEIVSAYLDVRMKGLGSKNITAIFPKISMVVVDGYNLKEEDPYFYLLKKASKCIAKCYYPDLLNYSKEDYDAEKYYARMGCRSRVNHEYKENGEYQQYARFNYGVVTLNLPQIALKVLNGDYDTFEDGLNDMYSIMKDAIVQRYNFVKELKAQDAPILFQYGGIARLEPEQTIEHLLKLDKASVSYGYLGIDDVVRLLTNDKENISTENGHILGQKIIDTLLEHVSRIKKETGLPVSLYSTPSEASIATLFNADKRKYSNVMPEWLLKREYYTNSFHFSSELPIDAFDKIRVESDFTKKATGGNISYVENSGKAYNSDAIIELIREAYENQTEYFAINTITDTCYKCGYVGEIDYDEDDATYTCPHCGNKDGREMKVQRRSCGYISNYNITHAVKGRMKEIKNRSKHI